MAFAAVSMTSFDAKLKNWYIDKKKMYLMDGYKTPLFNAITKNTNGGGKTWNVAIGAGSMVGGAGTYASSWANSTAGTDINFFGSYVDRFGHGFIDDKVIRASRTPDGAIEPALEEKLAQVKDQFIQGTEYQLFRKSAGGIGAVKAFAAGGVGGTITFSDNSATPATQRVRPGMVLNVSSLATGGSLRTTVWQVANVGDGQITVAPYAGSGSDIPIALDTVYINGDATKALNGIAEYCTKTTAELVGTPTSFTVQQGGVTVDRQVDTRALGGIRQTSVGIKFGEAFIQAGDTAMRYGANMSIIFTHPTNYSALKQERDSHVKYDFENIKGSPAVAGGTKGMSKADATRFGFKALSLDGGQRPVLVVPAWACQQDVSWAIELDSVWLETLGPWPSLKDLDGIQKMLRLTDGVNNSYVHELVGYGQFLCSAPGHQVCIIHDNNS